MLIKNCCSSSTGTEAVSIACCGFAEFACTLPKMARNGLKMTLFADIVYKLDEIAAKTGQAGERIATARDNLSRIQTDLNNMPSIYLSLLDEIDALAAANPGDAEIQRALTLKDKLVADFIVRRDYVDALIAAFDAITE